MNAKEQFLAANAHVDEAAVQPLPNSRKVYIEGSRPDVRVPMREISQSDTPTGMGGETNPPIYVYDCSGPYSDPQASIDIRGGLPALRARWIAERIRPEIYQYFVDVTFLNESVYGARGRAGGTTYDANVSGLLAALWIGGLFVRSEALGRFRAPIGIAAACGANLVRDDAVARRRDTPCPPGREEFHASS